MDADWAQKRIEYLEHQLNYEIAQRQKLEEQLRSDGHAIEEPIPQDEIIARIETGWVPGNCKGACRTNVGQEYWYRDHALDIVS